MWRSMKNKPGRERRSMRNCSIMVCAVHDNVKKVFKLEWSAALANKTAEFEDQEYLIMLSKVRKHVRKFSSLVEKRVSQIILLDSKSTAG